MYVCTNTQMCVSTYKGLWFVLGSARLPSREGKVTPLLRCISEALTVSFGILWCLNIGRYLGRPAEKGKMVEAEGFFHVWAIVLFK